MKLKKMAVWGFLFAGVLGVECRAARLVPPGFFSMSRRIPGTGGIIGHFVPAASFFALAVLSATLEVNHVHKK
jgi:hypothetical protein